MNYLNGVCSTGAGFGLTQLMHWGAKKITSSPIVSKVGSVVLGIIAPHLIDKVAEQFGFDQNVRTLISVGVLVASIKAGSERGNEETGSTQNNVLAKLTGVISGVSIACMSDFNTGAQVGYLSSFLVVDLLHTEQKSNKIVVKSKDDIPCWRLGSDDYIILGEGN